MPRLKRDKLADERRAKVENRKRDAPEIDNLGEWSHKYSLLSSTLQLAVPLWIDQLKGCSWDHVQQRAEECANEIAEHGDNVLFRSKKKGESAEAFNRLAEGIACLSFCPGGVKIFGSHWEACLSDDEPGRKHLTLLDLSKVIGKSLGELNK